MADSVKVALIAAVTVLPVTGIWVYFSPYQSCVRAAVSAGTVLKDYAQVWCARHSRS